MPPKHLMPSVGPSADLQRRYRFTATQDWFSKRIPVWEQHLLHLAGQPCRLLEIGSYEGRSAMWIAEHLLADPAARLWCIDPWDCSLPQYKGTAEATFDANRAACPRGQQIVKLKGHSADVLPQLLTGVHFARPLDLVYIDGCHEARNVIEDFVLAWPLVAAGGLVIFDDYPWTDPRHYRCPKPAIDCILDLWAPELQLLHHDWQVLVRKR